MNTLLKSTEEVLCYLSTFEGKTGEEVSLIDAAFAFACLFQPGISLDRYYSHIEKLCETAKLEWNSYIESGNEDNLESRADVLRHIMHEEFDYHGGKKNYDNLENTSLIRVIERREGLPIALGILYLCIARYLGWAADGLSFPGHFLIRFEMEGQRLILDPFNEGKALDAAGLRKLLKSVVGEKAELSHQFYEPVSNREIILRLENNLKHRLIEGEDFKRAAMVIEAMHVFAPDEYRLLFEAGVLYSRIGEPRKSIEMLEEYLSIVTDPHDRRDAENLLFQIRTEVSQNDNT